jgi:hypothetical protein
MLAAIVLSSAPATNAASWIVRDGQAQAEIAIVGQPARAAELGASELQTYIEKQKEIGDVM